LGVKQTSFARRRTSLVDPELKLSRILALLPKAGMEFRPGA